MEPLPSEKTPVTPRPIVSPLLGPRFIASAALGTVLVAIAIGIPTDVVPNPWFTRMTPASASNYFFWVASSALTGALLATYVLPRAARGNIAAASAGSGYLGVLAVGCPVCNKLVVALLGVSGAFNYFAPIQPLLGAAGLMLAAVALTVRLRAARGACAIDLVDPTPQA
ncbi:MAG TPA: hypothetical protein VFY69_04445 [Solirubrobacterales bacterium]|nr:hypothetical protein [Solirubrobacterales bacterium]